VPRRYGLSREDAADITQLTFTILVQSMDTLPEDSRLGAWLVTVARRHTWRLLNRKRREGEAEEHSSSSEGPELLSNSGTEDLEHWELTEWLNYGLSVVDKHVGISCPPSTWSPSNQLTQRSPHAWAWPSVVWDPAGFVA
jgi:hypothetical protein